MEQELDHLRQELKRAGVPPNRLYPRWAKSSVLRSAILSEVLVALQPDVHEGRIAPYGSIIVPPLTKVQGRHLVPVPDDQLGLARRAADGSSALIVIAGDMFEGLLLLEPAGTPELELARIAKAATGLVVRRDSNGFVVLLSQSGGLRCEGRRWSVSPSLDEACTSVWRVAEMADYKVLMALLEFAFHVLSPWHVGATLVWLLSEDDPFAATVDLRPLGASVCPTDTEPSLSFAAHLLAQYDGATVIGPDGHLKSAGLHLVPSEKAQAIVPRLPGTRHTSARQASFDHANSLIVTVSADGPVTIFSDGLDIFSLSWFSAAAAAASMRRAMGEGGKDSVWASEHSATCKKCGKTSEIATLTVTGWRGDEEASCPVCGTVIATGHCYEIAANLIKVF